MFASSRRGFVAMGACGAASLAGCVAARKSPAIDNRDTVIETVEAEQVTPEEDEKDVEGATAPGPLHVEGAKLLDQNDEPFQLRGISTHGIAWFGQYVNAETFATFASWGANCIRLALYTADYTGYCEGGDQAQLFDLVCTGIDVATGLGLYAIADWHVLSDQNPLRYEDAAREFFSALSERYKDNVNVLYEICNEPNGDTTWADVKTYAQSVIPVIRANNPDAVILVGTPTWSQDVDVAAADPIDADNLMYSLHFYAATHKEDLRARADAAIEAGLPLFITEFGTCDASGSGGNDFESAEVWLEWADANDISYCIWNVSNKDETSALLRPDTEKVSDWSDEELSEAGLWYKQWLATSQ